MNRTGMARAVAVLLAFFAGAPLASHGAEVEARRFASNHQGVVGGQKLRYSAVVEENFITDSASKRTASVFTTSYIRTDVPKGTQRPVMFVFNGGAGAASITLSSGFAGAPPHDFEEVVGPAAAPPSLTNTPGPTVLFGTLVIVLLAL